MAICLKVGFFLLSFALGCSAWCSKYDVERCEESSGLKSYLVSQGIDITSEHAQKTDWLYTLDKTQLGKYCSFFDAYKKCMNRDVIYECDNKVKKLYIGINDAMHYLCKETFQEYIEKHQQCLQDDSVRAELIDCANDAVNDMKHDVYKNQVCRDAKEGLDCANGVVKRKCGKETAKWHKTFNTKIIKPVLDYIGCNSLHISWWIITLVVLVVSAIAVTCAIGLRKRMRSGASTRASRAASSGHVAVTANQSVDAPPPYPGNDQVVISDKRQLVPV